MSLAKFIINSGMYHLAEDLVKVEANPGYAMDNWNPAFLKAISTSIIKEFGKIFDVLGDKIKIPYGKGGTLSISVDGDSITVDDGKDVKKLSIDDRNVYNDLMNYIRSTVKIGVNEDVTTRDLELTMEIMKIVKQSLLRYDMELLDYQVKPVSKDFYTILGMNIKINRKTKVNEWLRDHEVYDINVSEQPIKAAFAVIGNELRNRLVDELGWASEAVEYSNTVVLNVVKLPAALKADINKLKAENKPGIGV